MLFRTGDHPKVCNAIKRSKEAKHIPIVVMCSTNKMHSFVFCKWTIILSFNTQMVFLSKKKLIDNFTAE